MVFHNLWKEKMENCAQSAKKVRICKAFFKCVVENYVESVDKATDSFPQKYVEKKKRRSISLFGDSWKRIVGILDIFF